MKITLNESTCKTFIIIFGICYFMVKIETPVYHVVHESVVWLLFSFLGPYIIVQKKKILFYRSNSYHPNRSIYPTRHCQQIVTWDDPRGVI